MRGTVCCVPEAFGSADPVRLSRLELRPCDGGAQPGRVAAMVLGPVEEIC